MLAIYPKPCTSAYSSVIATAPVVGSGKQTPKATSIKPICEMVENAKTRLMSLCAHATAAA